MEYERIHKVQTGIISPSKLRMKLMGVHHQMKKKEGSNSNSARTSPSKLDDSEFVKNSLLASSTSDFDDQVSSMEVSSVLKVSGNAVSDASDVDQGSCQTQENGIANRVKIQQFSKTDSAYSNSSSVHPMRTLDDENLDYDSNASSSSFEFHKGERATHNPISKSLLRPMSSKWNDAEKWIINKHSTHGNHSKKNALRSQANRIVTMSAVRVAPESANSVKRVDFCLPTASQVGLDKFSFDPPMPQPDAGQASCGNVAIDMSTESSDLKEMDNIEISRGNSTEDTTDVPGIRSVSMRDMGTEMTPIPSQEPSRTSTPLGATTPLRSPTSSIPSTPRGGPISTPVEQSFGSVARRQTENGRNELSEQELKLKTRKEILALGVQLGKTNIAAWASNEEKEKKASAVEAAAQEEVLRIEFEKRAAAWEDAEKSKHNARFKREEIKIHAWESQQKAKLEAELRRIEAQVEQMRANARAKMVKKIAMARQRSEERLAAAEAMKNSQAEKTAAQAEYIRQTGRIPSSPYLCCGWS